MAIIKRTASSYTLQIFSSREDGISPYLTGDRLSLILQRIFNLDSQSLNLEDSISVDISKRNRNFLFGTIGRNTEMAKDQFAQTRPNPNSPPVPITDDLKIEFFTYFMIYYPTATLIVLNVSKSPNAPIAIRNYINSGAFIEVSDSRIVPLIAQLRRKLRGWSKLTEFSVVTTDSAGIDVLPSTREITRAFRHGHIKGYKIKVKVAPMDITPEVADALLALDYSDVIGDDEKVVIKGISNNGKSDTFDLTKQFLQDPIIIEHQYTRESLSDGIERAFLCLITANS